MANLRPWKPGQSGNADGLRGRIKTEAEIARDIERAEIERLAKNSSKQALERIIELVGSKDERVAIMAAREVLDRAWGKVKSVEDGDPAAKSLTINIVRYSDGNQPSIQLDSSVVSVRPLALSGSGRQAGPGGLSS
jgi:hypothetical protein